MTFQTNTKISEPVEDTSFTMDKDMNGFGFDKFQGLFIVKSEEIDYFPEPSSFNDLRDI